MKKKLRVMTGRSGFTLVELMVTVGIFAIMASIAVPALTTWLPGYNLKSAARDIFSNMQMAKLDAIKRNTSCDVTVDPVANTYTIALSTPRTINLHDSDPNLKFKSTSANIITFTARGMVNPSGSIFITNTQNTASYEISVTSVGYINMKKE